MAHCSSVRFPVLVVSSVLVVACGGGTGNGTPRIQTVPAQSTTGGTAVSLDLSTYVSDREGDPITYAVVTGGGSFTGSTYSHTFDTLGEYTVGFTATDSNGNAATGTFDVRVTTANFAVVNEDNSGLMLLDTATNAFVRVAAGAATPTFATGLGDGKLVYTRGSGAVQTLWLFDTFTRQSRQIGDGTHTHVTWRAKTADDRLVLTTGTAPDTDLWFYNPRTNLLTEVSAVDGELDGDPLVNGDDLVFYERGNAGQADIYFFDPSTGTSTAVSTDANDEQLQAVLPDDGIVFSRVGAGGEHDLWYFRRGTGLVEIGTNVPALATTDKVYGGHGTGSQIVFTADDATNVELWWWSPGTGLATAIATAGTYGYAGIGAGNEVVFFRDVSGTERDLSFFDLDNATTASVRNSTDIGTLLGVTGDGTTNWAIVGGSGTNNIAAVSLVAAPATVAQASSSAVTLDLLLDNGDAVLVINGATGIARFDVSAGAFTAIAGAGLAVGGPGVDAGDFVYRATVTSQTDLHMWDDSAVASVAVSTTAGNDEFAAATVDGTILFTREIVGNTNADLFVWHPTNGETQLTDLDTASLRHDHAVAGTYTAAH